jgi:type II secretory pathway pseudopilin PulG
MKRSNEAGFSIIDVMIAVTILLVGVLALVAATARAIVNTTISQETLIAKQFAASTIEGIFSARDLDSLGWNAVGNVGSSEIPGGTFVTGEQDIWPTAGADGIVGTSDDSSGPDGIAGNSDDGTPAEGYRRRITISNVPDPIRPSATPSLRRIDVTILYSVGGKQFEETFTTFVANYRADDTQ